MIQPSPITLSHPLIAQFLPELDPPPSTVLGSILAGSLAVPVPRVIRVALEEFDSNPIHTCFEMPRYSPAFLEAKRTILLAQSLLDGDEELSELCGCGAVIRSYTFRCTGETITQCTGCGKRSGHDVLRVPSIVRPAQNYEWNKALWKEGLSVGCGRSSLVSYWGTTKELLDVYRAEYGAPKNPFSLKRKPVNNRKRRPTWALNDWKMAQQILGTNARIARLLMVDNLNPLEIAQALNMKLPTIQKAIYRMGISNDITRFGLQSLDKDCLPRKDFLRKYLREENPGVSKPELDRMVVTYWFGEQVNRYSIAVLYWQEIKSAVDIAEERGMTVGSVEMILDRLKEKKKKESKEKKCQPQQQVTPELEEIRKQLL